MMTKYTGVIPNPWFSARERIFQSAARPLPAGDEADPWAGCINVVDDQGREGSCESASLCGILEALIRRHFARNAFAPDLQLDRRRLHRLAQEARYPGKPYDPARGLMMGDSFRAAQAAGLVPDDAEEILLAPDVGEMRQALLTCPLHIGIAVPGTFEEPNPATGEIKRGDPTDVRGGHALHIVRLYASDDGERMPLWSIVNTWGTGWGWHGVCAMDHDWLAQLMLDHPRAYAWDYAAWAHDLDAWSGWLVAPDA